MKKRRIRATMLTIQDILIKAMISRFCKSMYLSYFNHLLVTGRGDQFACANQEECIHASYFLYDKFLKQPLLRMHAVNEHFEISRVY